MKLLSPVWLLATPWTAAYQAPPSMGFSRQEHWSGGATAFSHRLFNSMVLGFPSQIFISSGIGKEALIGHLFLTCLSFYTIWIKALMCSLEWRGFLFVFKHLLFRSHFSNRSDIKTISEPLIAFSFKVPWSLNIYVFTNTLPICTLNPRPVIQQQ